MLLYYIVAAAEKELFNMKLQDSTPLNCMLFGVSLAIFMGYLNLEGKNPGGVILLIAIKSIPLSLIACSVYNLFRLAIKNSRQS